MPAARWTTPWSIARETSKGFNAKKDGNPDRDDRHATSVSGRPGWQLNTAHRLEGNFLYNDTDGGYDVSKTADDRSLHRLQTLGLNYSRRSGAKATRRACPSHRFARPLRDQALGLLHRHPPARLPVLQRTAPGRAPAHGGVGAARGRADQRERQQRRSNRSQNALALGWGLRLGAHTLQLNARHDDDSEFGGKSTGSAAYGFAFAPNWRATASAGTAFKAPTLYQRFSLYGDDTLRPETSRNAWSWA